MDKDSNIRRIMALEEQNILRTEEEIIKQEIKKLPSKYIPAEAKARNYIMSCFDLWTEYELYRFCQSAPTNIGDIKKRTRYEE